MVFTKLCLYICKESNLTLKTLLEKVTIYVLPYPKVTQVLRVLIFAQFSFVLCSNLCIKQDTKFT